MHDLPPQAKRRSRFSQASRPADPACPAPARTLTTEPDACDWQPAAGSYARFSASEVALDAHLADDRVLVLKLVQRRRLRSGWREHRAARHLLIQMKPVDLGRERQILDRSPAGQKTKLRHVVVGIAGIGAGRVSDQCPAGVAGGEDATIGAFRSRKPGAGSLTTRFHR